MSLSQNSMTHYFKSENERINDLNNLRKKVKNNKTLVLINCNECSYSVFNKIKSYIVNKDEIDKLYKEKSSLIINSEISFCCKHIAKY